VRDLEVPHVPGNDRNAYAQPLDQQGIIARVDAARLGVGVRSLQERSLEGLRGLRGDEAVALQSLDDVSLGNSLHGVNAGYRRGRGSMGGSGYDHIVKEVWRHKRPRSVVDADDLGVGRPAQGAGHRVLPAAATGDQIDVVEPGRGSDVSKLCPPALGRSDDQPVEAAGDARGFQGEGNQRPALHLQPQLVRPQALSPSERGDEQCRPQRETTRARG